MRKSPLAIEDNAHDAVNFIGAQTYFETNDILKERCRIVRPKAFIVFSRRDDIMRERNDAEHIREMEERGFWRRVSGSGPMPYLPNHPEYGAKIQGTVPRLRSTGPPHRGAGL